jgi:indole-3-glycerol phosphate synthase
MQFKESLKKPGTRIIAEFKRASPSLGDIDVTADPAERARMYEEGGAAAMSVLCEGPRFKGSPDDLRRAKGAAGIPLLGKDFISTKERLAEVRSAGASAALLIVRYLDDALLAELLAETRALGMDALVEAHTAEEIARAVKVGADIIGVNCRDLETLSVDLSVSERLLGEIPEGIVRVAESGVRTRADIERLAAAGADAFLIGTTLMKSSDPVRQLRALIG